MTKKIAFLAFAVLFLGTGIVYADNEEMRVRASEAAKKLLHTLKGRLQSAVKTEGFARAVQVCSIEALDLTAQIKEKDLEIKRVTFKNRNPKNVPDVWEADQLKKMEKDIANKELKKFYEGYDFIDGKKVYRFMKPLKIGALCLNCHGTPDKLDAEAIVKIRQIYPNDKAIGYKLGTLRGAVSVKIKM